jgi:uncharacterized protein (TIGR02996 family)
MSEEHGFLDALDESPDDGLTRLAYADWLEERGDARAELLRLEEALRVGDPLPARLWALHGTLDAEWVVRVSRSAPLAELRLLVPPPRLPVRPQGDWAEAEAALGMSLPPDYKAFLDTYGLGEFNGFLKVGHPFTSTDLRGFWDSQNAFYEFVRGYTEVRYPIYPAPGGLLAFCHFGDLAMLAWLTAGEPHHWPLVYAGLYGVIKIEGQSVIGLLLELASGGSTYLGEMGLEIIFKSFWYFEPSWPGKQAARWLHHPETLDLTALAGRLVARWPAGEARVFQAPSEVLILHEKHQLTIDLGHGLEGTALGARHGLKGEEEVRVIWSEMEAAGFRDLG